MDTRAILVYSLGAGVLLAMFLWDEYLASRDRAHAQRHNRERVLKAAKKWASQRRGE